MRHNSLATPLPSTEPLPEKGTFLSALKIAFEKSGKASKLIAQVLRNENHSFSFWDLHREIFSIGPFTNVGLKPLYFLNCD
jgi:hypothetical protein